MGAQRSCRNRPAKSIFAHATLTEAGDIAALSGLARERTPSGQPSAATAPIPFAKMPRILP